MKRLIVAVFSLFMAAAQAEIRVADDLAPIEEAFREADAGTLILLDIGGTLLNHRDPVLHPVHEEWKRAWFKKHRPGAKHEDHVIGARIIEGGIENWYLVDPRWPELVEAAQERGAKVVALTKVYVDPTLRGLRSRNLHLKGIKVKDALAGLADGKSYIYGDGVIETEALFKGSVLAELLANLEEKPKRILFVDDRLEQVSSVESASMEANIPCIAFHFTRIRQNPPLLDEKVAHYQLTIFITENRWICEEGAREEMKFKNIL